MDISIIIVNWNSAGHLRNCLKSIYPVPMGKSLEVVVVDNASYDGAGKMIGEQFSQVRFVQSDQNLGFARGNNLGVRSSSGRVLVFLNPDTLVSASGIAQIAENLESLADAGAMGCKILNADGTLQTSAVQSFPTILNQALDFERLRQKFPNSPLWGMGSLFSSSNAPVPVEMISGACIAVRRNVFEQVGEFSSEYFMYGEDVDLCKKIWISGWKIYYLPSTSIVHLGGQSTKLRESSDFSTICLQESMQTYVSKFYGPAYGIAYRLSRVVMALLRTIALISFTVLGGSPETKRARSASLRKWWTVFCWSIGIKKLGNTGTFSSSGQAGPASKPVTARPSNSGIV
jgi:N-acetylglucosaminyl-diphospho-decaprenol L-rhamnosyltransferase